MQPYLFNFYWDGIGVVASNESLQSQHALFNEAFTQVFPKLLYTVPYSTYNNSGIGFNSRLSGGGEVDFDDPATLKNVLVAIAQNVDITGDPSKLVVQVDDPNTQTFNIQPDPSNVNPLATTDGTKQLLNSIGLPDNPIDAAKSTLMTFGVIALGLIVLLNRKR